MSGMLSKLSASLKIYTVTDVVYLHPPRQVALSSADASMDPSFGGHVKLTLPRSRHITAIVVSLSGTAILAVPGRPVERGTPIYKELKIEIDKVLEKGEHTYQFSFTIPSTAAPYERSQYGRIFHKIHAQALGASMTGGIIEDSLIVYPIVNPGPALVEDSSGHGPSRGVAGTHSLEIAVQEFSPELGPYSISLSSPHLTPAGAIRVQISLPATPDTHHLKIHHVAVYIEQRITLFPYQVSGDLSGPPEAFPCPPVQRTVLRLDGSWRRRLPIDDWNNIMGYSAEERASRGRTAASKVKARSLSRPPTRSASRTESTDGRLSASDSLTRIRIGTPEPSPPISADNSAFDFSLPPAYSAQPSTSTAPPPSSGSSGTSTPVPAGVVASGTSTPVRTTASSSGATELAHSLEALSMKSQNAEEALVIVPAGAPFKLTRIARLPDDNSIRPTTMPATQTPIRVSHEVVVECIYERIPVGREKALAAGEEGGKRRALRLRRDIVITSCCCQVDSLVLPSYTVDDPNTVKVSEPGFWDRKLYDGCVCGESLERVVTSAFKDESGLLGLDDSNMQEGLRFRAFKPGEIRTDSL